MRKCCHGETAVQDIQVETVVLKHGHCRVCALPVKLAQCQLAGCGGPHIQYQLMDLAHTYSPMSNLLLTIHKQAA
jgi:hypothetical protein